jgi:hypothetical protein
MVLSGKETGRQNTALRMYRREQQLRNERRIVRKTRQTISRARCLTWSGERLLKTGPLFFIEVAVISAYFVSVDYASSGFLSRQVSGHGPAPR